MRITLADVKNSQIPKSIGLAGCSTEFLNIVNEAVQRLLMGPEIYWETYQRYRFRCTLGKVTWPRQVASVLSLAVDGVPYKLHNEWFEFLDSGYGLRQSTETDDRGIDRGTSPLIDDINNADGEDAKTIKFYGSVTETTAEKIIVKGYDWDGNWIRTQEGGEWIDGEAIQVPPLSTTPRTSAFNWSAITDIIKPVTNGEILLYERDTVSGDQRKIGHYESDETRPSYRRTLIPGLNVAATDTTTYHTVTATIKREYMQLRKDNDHLLINSIPALKDMCMSIRLREQHKFNEAEVYEQKARQTLDREVSHYIGQGNLVPIRIVSENFGAADLPSIQ